VSDVPEELVEVVLEVELELVFSSFLQATKNKVITKKEIADPPIILRFI